MNKYILMFLISLLSVGSVSAFSNETNFTFIPDVNETNSTDIAIVCNINGSDFEGQIPDVLAVIVSYAYWDSYYNGWASPSTLEENFLYYSWSAGWNKSFDPYNPIEVNLQSAIISKGLQNYKLKIYGRVVGGFYCDPYCSYDYKYIVAWDTIIYNGSYYPVETPITPTPTPTPTPQPNITSAPEYTNYSYDTETQQESWTEYSEGTVGGWTDSIDSVFTAIDAPIVGMRTHIQSVNTSLSQFNSTIHMNFLVMFVPTIIGAIPEKLQALVTLFFILLVILIILGRE